MSDEKFPYPIQPNAGFASPAPHDIHAPPSYTYSQTSAASAPPQPPQLILQPQATPSFGYVQPVFVQPIGINQSFIRLSNSPQHMSKFFLFSLI